MVTTHPERCPKNHACPSLRVCPTGAITQRGHAAPTVDQSKCIDCGRCAMSCRVFEWNGARQRSMRPSL